MGFGNTTDSAFAEILLLCFYNGTCKFVNIVTQCNELCKIARYLNLVDQSEYAISQ